MNTSAHLVNRSRTCCALAAFRLRETPRLFRFANWNGYASSEWGWGGIFWPFLHGSPSGGSILTTSAPKSDKMVAALGPAMKLDKSTTFNPENMLPSVICVPFLPITTYDGESFRTSKWRARFSPLSRRVRRLLPIVGIEPFSRLKAQSSFLDVLFEQFPRSRWEFGMDRRIMLFDVQHDIESDFVHKTERPTMDSKQNLEDMVHLGRCRNPFFDHFERLPLHGGPDAVKNEPDALFPDMKRNNPVEWQALHQIRNHCICRLSA